ncbi:MAG: twin-arginine translocation signal domain-containing protein [Microgenomates group bacterium]
MPLTRREFLRLSALTTTALTLLPLVRNNAEAAEGEPTPRAIGKFIDRSTGQVYGDELPILGVTGYYYLVQTKNGVRNYPIKNIQTLNPEQFPFDSVVQDQRLGYRCDDARFIYRLPTSGAGIDRIAFPSEDLGRGSYFDTAITLAEGSGLRAMIVNNPTHPRSDDYYRATCDFVLAHHPGALLELGNEMDNTTEGYLFWENQDYDTFAHFIKVSQDFIYQKDANYQPIVGALVDVANTGKLLTALVNAGVNIGHLQYAVHAYQSIEDLPNRLWRMNQVFNQFKISPKIHCTELGAQYPYLEKGVLLNMVQRAYQTNVESIVIHELFDYFGFGTVSTEWTAAYPIFMQINALVRQVQQGISSPVYEPAVKSTKTTPIAPPKPTRTPPPYIKNGQT